jgi:formate dehydrogenase iron-sulfur subunit
MSDKTVGLLFDMVRCSGCRECVKACMERNGFEGDPKTTTELSATACTALVENDAGSLRNLCRHCREPSCASVCPVGALEKTALGPVTYDAERCIGCRYCILACPFSIPRYEWDKVVPAVRKCDMCHDRLLQGEIPACAKACDYEATVFGTREELLAQARSRIAEEPDEYYDHIYGETEIGGTAVLFLAPAPEPRLGYKAVLGTQPLPRLTLKQLHRVPHIVTMGGAALMAIWWITKRRDEVQAFEGRQQGRHHGNGTH